MKLSATLAARGVVQTDELPARTRTALAPPSSATWTAGAAQPDGAPCRAGGDRAGGERLHRHAARRPRAAEPGPAGEPEGAGPVHGQFDSLQAYLEHVSLVMDLDRGAGDDAVQIMTLHAAKGLEFPLVFLPGWEEGVFPSQRSMDEKGEKGLEEERRLAYVGVTRAREQARHRLRRQPPGLRPLDLPAALPLRGRAAPGQRRGAVGDGLLRRRPGHAGGQEPLRRRAQPSPVQLHLARLEAGAGTQRASRPSDRAVEIESRAARAA